MKNGAMKLHQSAWALLPCTKIRPGLPISPQVNSSILAPSTGISRRSGALASASLNHCGLSGSAPLNRASGEPISGGRLGSSRTGSSSSSFSSASIVTPLSSAIAPSKSRQPANPATTHAAMHS